MLNKDTQQLPFSPSAEDLRRIRKLGGFIQQEQTPQKKMTSEQVLNSIQKSLLGLSTETSNDMNIVQQYMDLHNQILTGKLLPEQAMKALDTLDSKYQPIPASLEESSAFSRFLKPVKNFFQGILHR